MLSWTVAGRCAGRQPWALLALVAALLTALPSCASTYRRLATETSVEELAQTALAFRRAQDDLLLAPTHDPDQPGAHAMRVAVHRLGAPAAGTDPARVIVFLHGVLADSRTWRYVAGALADHRRLWLVDFPGVGASETIPPGAMGPEAYSPAWLADRVAQALEQALAARDSETRLTIVGHSLGGAVALQLLTNPHIRQAHADVVGRIDGVALLAPLDANAPLVNPAVLRAARATDMQILLGRITGALQESVARAVVANAADPSKVPREVVDMKIALLSESATRRPAQAMILRAAPNDGQSLDWRRVEELEAQQRQARTPALILWGHRDSTLPVSMGYKLAAQLPGAQLIVIDRVKHSPHIDMPLAVAAIIDAFVDASPLPLDPARWPDFTAAVSGAGMFHAEHVKDRARRLRPSAGAAAP